MNSYLSEIKKIKIKQTNLLLIYSCIYFYSAFATTKELVWHDEFEKDGPVNTSKWQYEVGRIRNKELQYYTNGNTKNARVRDGNLIIESHKIQKEPADKFSSWLTHLFEDNFRYTSASITTEHLAGWQNGRIEVRAKLPQGRGVWPAIWLVGKNFRQVGWPQCGEIDIMEYVGHKPNTIHGFLHSDSNNHTKNNARRGTVEIKNLGIDFHVYAIDRTPNKIDFWIDDRIFYSYEKENNSISSWPFDQPMYLIINLAIGGSWGGQKGVDNSIFPQQFLIDYVRVYK